MVASDVTSEILTCNLSLATATALSLELVGPPTSPRAPKIVPQTQLVVGATPLGAIPAGQWLTWNVLATDCPVGGHWEIVIVATIAGMTRRTLPISLDVDGI
ncbi:MAG: hypothetical protein NVS1B2_27100 [Vulcanimicrobiaceae bacterium]